MFGIGGGELIFIMFIVLMLFGSDKVPEIARTVAKTMAQIKNATNDIKAEIQKGAESNGFDKQSLVDLTGNINAEIDKAKENLLGDTTIVKDFSITENLQTKQVEQELSSIENLKEDSGLNTIEAIEGPIKRQG